MLRKCLLCLAAFLLLFTLAAAETAEEAAPAENPSIGVWQIAYYIHEGKLVTDPMTVEGGLPTMIEFHEETLTVHYPDGDHNEAAYEYMGNTCSAWGGSSVFTLEGKDLIICREGGLSFILTRIDPLVLNNPFIGEWKVLYIQDRGTILDILEYATSIGMAIPTTGEFVMPVTFDASTFTLNNQLYACSYADSACTIYDDDEIEAVCTIGEDGLLHIVNPEDTGDAIVCVRTDEVVSEDISRFYGLWREIALIYDGVLVTDQQPSGFLFQFDFSRGLVRRTCDMIPDFPALLLRVIYQDGDCKILYDDAPALCTIDANGMMCIRSENGNGVSWLVRVQDETPVEAPADIE